MLGKLRSLIARHGVQYSALFASMHSLGLELMFQKFTPPKQVCIARKIPLKPFCLVRISGNIRRECGQGEWVGRVRTREIDVALKLVKKSNEVINRFLAQPYGDQSYSRCFFQRQKQYMELIARNVYKKQNNQCETFMNRHRDTHLCQLLFMIYAHYKCH